MSTSKYGHLIDLHNKAIDILEKKRNNALIRLQEAEQDISMWKEGGKMISYIYSLEDLEFKANVQRRYISLLSRAYSRLASSACREVTEPVVGVSSDVVNDLILLNATPVGYEWKTIGEGEISSHNERATLNFFNLIENTSPDATKAD